MQQPTVDRPTFEIVLPGTLLFVTLFYMNIVPVAYVLDRVVLLFPFLGRSASFVATAILFWMVLLLMLHFIHQHHETLWPGLPEILTALNRRTGISRLDRVSAVACIAAAVLLLLTNLTLLPAAVAAAVTFLSLGRRQVEKWPVRSWRAEPPPLPTPTPAVADEDRVRVEYHWEWQRDAERKFGASIAVVISQGRYREARARNLFNEGPVPHAEAVRFLLGDEGIIDEVRQTASALVVMSIRERFTTYEELANVLAFTQSMQYEMEPREYWRFPVETLMDRRGDCDCFAILAAAIFRTMGHHVVILIGQGHAAVGVAGADGLPGEFVEHEGRRYYFCETTAEGWHVGELPAGLRLEAFAVYVLPEMAEVEAAA